MRSSPLESFSAVEARRIALRAQGFGLRPAGRATTADLQRVVDHVNVVQIDSVNVLERSHYLPFFARVGPYDRKALDAFCYEDRQMFEYWAHMASFSPIGQYPLLRHRMDGAGWWRATPANSEAILEEVRLRGPLTVGQLEDGGQRSGHWWGWSQGKSALEWLFSRGLVAVASRKNFARLYDVPERVIPAAVLALPPIPAHEAQREMLRIGARAHGIGTARDIADYFRIKITIARLRLRELVDGGELIPVRVEGWEEEAYVLPAVAPPAAIHARALLSPFDSLVWDRARDLRLFNFHYRIEIYTPSPKRIFGYYVLPFLLGDQLVGRVDLKANRQAGTLEARAAHLEPGHNPAEAAAELWEELQLMAGWLGLERVEAGGAGNLAPDLRKAAGPPARKKKTSG